MLWENRLTGPIPLELANLRSLVSLVLSSNRLTGPVPGGLGNIPTLKELFIDENPLTGRLPRDLIGLPLQYFDWSDTDVCAPPDDAFQEWLASIEHRDGKTCPG